MPNKLFLKVMGVPLHTYNGFTPEQKDRFQKEAQQKLAELHEEDIDSYCELTGEAETEESTVQEPELTEPWNKGGNGKSRKRKQQENKESE